MDRMLTISCKLSITPEQAQRLDDVMRSFAAACNWIHETLPGDLTNRTRMQPLIYGDVRARFGLSANLAIQAIFRVSSSRKSAKANGFTVKQFSPTSVAYDARIFTFREKDWAVTLTTMHGRIKLNLIIGKYQRDHLAGQTPTSATLVKRKNGSFCLNIQVKRAMPKQIHSNNVIGIDLGRRDIAYTSEGQSFSGAAVTKVRDHYSQQRAAIQQRASKGTRSTRRRCRRLQQRLSGKEKRFQTWVNHIVSFRLIQRAIKANASLAIESLTGIRERTNKQPRSKTERRRSNSWAFYQLRRFLAYKAEKFGVALVQVDPAYTSQTCHNCLHLGDRQGKSFACAHCGVSCDADLNGAKVISLLGAAVNRPGGPGLFCSLSDGPRAAESSSYDVCG